MVNPGAIRRKELQIVAYLAVSFFLFVAIWGASSLNWLHLILFVELSLALALAVKLNSPTMTFYFVMMVFYYVFVPTIHYHIGVAYYSGRREGAELSVEAFIFLFSNILFIVIGYILPFSAVRNIPLKNENGATRASRVAGISFCLVLLGGAIYLFGADRILAPRAYQFDELTSYEWYWRNVIKVTPAILLVYWLSSGGLDRRWWYLSPVFIALVIIQMCISNPVNTARFISLAGMLAVFALYAQYKGRLSLLMWAIVLSPLLGLLILPLGSSMRFGIDSVDMTSIAGSFSSLEFSAFSTLVDGFNVDVFPHKNYMLSHIFVFIPGSLWEGKAGAIGMIAAQDAGYVFDNIGMFSFFNPYVDYGYFGLVTVSFLFGATIRKFNVLNRRPNFFDRRYVYSLLIFVSIPMIIRGDLSTAMNGIYAMALSYEFVRLIVRGSRHGERFLVLGASSPFSDRASRKVVAVRKE